MPKDAAKQSKVHRTAPPEQEAVFQMEKIEVLESLTPGVGVGV